MLVVCYQRRGVASGAYVISRSSPKRTGVQAGKIDIEHGNRGSGVLELFRLRNGAVAYRKFALETGRRQGINQLGSGMVAIECQELVICLVLYRSVKFVLVSSRFLLDLSRCLNSHTLPVVLELQVHAPARRSIRERGIMKCS